MTERGAGAMTTGRGPGRGAMRREAVRISDALRAAGHVRADGAFATSAEAATAFGKSVVKSGKYVATARSYPHDRRRIDPAFSDHRGVARLPEAEAAAVFGKSAVNSGKYPATSRGYPPLRRRNELVFSHHCEVACLPEAECERLLDLVAAETWTRAEMRTAAEIVERVAPEGARNQVAPEVRPV